MTLGDRSTSSGCRERLALLDQDRGACHRWAARRTNAERRRERNMERIAIIGSGVVGRATGKGFSKLGHDVVFVDIDPYVVRRLRQEGHQAVDLAALLKVQPSVSMICVPTPNDRNGCQNLTFLKAALAAIGPLLAGDDYHLVVVRSTVLPTVSENLVAPALEGWSGGKAGRDFGVCMNPEFIREASAEDDFLNPWIVVIGELDERSGDLLEGLYEPLCQRSRAPIFRTDLRTAEMTKYAHNLFNAAKISFANEMWMASEDLGIDGNQVMALVAQSAEGMWNPRYGIRGGLPYGGACLPKDISAFVSFARDLGWHTPLLEATIEVNQRTAENVGRRLALAESITSAAS
jgi:UDPglucose 6-dehydrogenase